MENKKKLNILILSWRGPGHPNAGGAEVSTHEHAKGWVKAGHCVTLFTSYYQGAKEDEIIDGVKIKRCGRQVFGVQWEVFKWYRFKVHPKFDLVIDQFHGIPFLTPLFVKEKKLGFIHEVAKEVWRLNPWPKPMFFIPAILGTLIEPLIFKFLYRKIPFMTVSDSTKEDLISWGIPKINITVVHNGVNMPNIKIPRKEAKNTLIYLGAISKDKGIEDALRVFSLLNKIGDFQFWIVGKSDPAYLEFLKKIVKNLGIEKKTKFWGYVSEDKKYGLLGKSHILVNPSVREGWGLVVIEAAQMGTPTIAYDVPGLRDSIVDGRTGILCKKRNTLILTEAVIELINDKIRYARFSKQAFLWSKNFNWEKSAKMSLDLINRIAG